MRAASERQATTMTQLLAGLIVPEDIPPFPYWEARYWGEVRASEFSLSTLKAVLVLAHLVGGEYLSLIDIAKRLQMGSSAIHRYLSTLRILGIVEQDPETRKYRLAS
jgi:biotin operon repressor